MSCQGSSYRVRGHRTGSGVTVKGQSATSSILKCYEPIHYLSCNWLPYMYQTDQQIERQRDLRSNLEQELDADLYLRFITSYHNHRIYI